jgi:hypothetical protein
MFFTLQFSTLNVSHYTICVCLNSPSPLHTMVLSHVIFCNTTNILLYTILYTKEAKITVQQINRGAALC